MKLNVSKKLSFLSILLVATTTTATNGYLAHCIGTDKCGTGGAGVASSDSAIDGLINPALLSGQKNHVVINAGLFHPVRTMNTSNAPIGNSAVKSQTSKVENFPDSALGIAYNYDNVTLGLSFAALGGMSTKYAEPRTNINFQISPPFDKQILYRLALIAPAISYAINDQFTAGLSLQIGYSDIKTDSAKQAGQLLAQTNGKLKQDTAYGFGGRFGLLWKLNDKLNIGATYASPVYFSKFSKYKDIFNGSINTPMNTTIGILYSITPETKMLFDYKRIFYSKVKLIGSKPTEGGFGWRDQDIFMIGLRHTIDNITASIGFNYGKSQIPNNRIFVNALLPATINRHYTAGLSYRMNGNSKLSLSGFYAPKNTQTDPGDGDQFSQFGKGTKVSMYQYGFLLGLKYDL